IICASTGFSEWSINSLDYWKGTYSDTKYVIASPLRWNKGDWAECAFIVGTTGGIMSQDEEIQNWAQGERSSTSDKFFPLIGDLGSWGAAATLGSIYLGGCITHNTKLKRTSLLATKSVIASGVIIVIFKVLIGRSRPYKEEGACVYSPFNIHSKNQSFPSGHTSTAFSIVGCISEEYKNPLISVVMYGTAILVGLSRIHDNKHWASDVFVGSVIGISVGKTIAKLHLR
ncbi:unnamed protein product, partial [marine sediment metagenome]